MKIESNIPEFEFIKYNIDDVFIYNGITIITKEIKSGKYVCPECIFFNQCLKDMIKFTKICIPGYREDNNNVYFIKKII